MLRTSMVLWLAAAFLMIGALASGLCSLISQARLNHASDVYRDDVAESRIILESAGAYDFDKGAAKLGIPAYAGNSAEERAEFERKVGFRTTMFLTDSVVARIEAGWARAAWQYAVISGACIMMAVVLGWQAVRVRRLERAVARMA